VRCSAARAMLLLVQQAQLIVEALLVTPAGQRAVQPVRCSCAGLLGQQAVLKLVTSGTGVRQQQLAQRSANSQSSCFTCNRLTVAQPLQRRSSQPGQCPPEGGRVWQQHLWAITPLKRREYQPVGPCSSASVLHALQLRGAGVQSELHIWQPAAGVQGQKSVLRR
jgi:hypothetical protein